MHKWIIPLILILTLLIPAMAHAQGLLTLSSLEIDLWPEYDKPSVLVIYRLALSTDTSLPIALSIRIPTAAGEPNAVASRQVDSTLVNINYTRRVSGEWAYINFTTTTAEIQVEYYDPGLQKVGNARHYQYLWPGDYAATALTIQVQQPFGATDMRISPSLGAGAAGSDGLTYFSQNIGSVSAGQNIQISVDYQKSNDTLSAENLKVQPSAPIPQSATQNLNLSQWLPWVLGILGAALIIGGVVWFWQTGRQRSTPPKRQRHSRAASREVDAALVTAEEDVYCSHCGKRALPGDRFCRSCGTPIRGK
jgi:zinc-ribbon domain